jgi:hypothetical protein
MMNEKEIKKMVAKDLKNLDPNWHILTKLQYLKDLYGNVCASFLSQDEVERAKIFSLAWKHVDTLLLTILENKLKKLAEEKLMIERLRKRVLNSK